MSFRTQIGKQSRFKVEVENDHECYIYIFGLETDQSTYVLFPYTEKHSPYCGITGSRVFPKDYSLFPDDVGSLDYFVIVATKDAIDYNEYNRKLSASKQMSLDQRINNVFGSSLVDYRSSCTNNMVELDFQFGNRGVAAAIIEVAKQ